MEPTTAFRLDSQRLSQRLPPGALIEAAGVCGLQHTAPDAVLLALHARVQGIQADDFNFALSHRRLLLTHSLRGAMYSFPGEDAPVFTLGLLPEDEEELRFFIQGAVPALERVGITARQVIDHTEAAALELLAGGVTLDRDRLGRELGLRIAGRLTPGQSAEWNGPSPYAPKQFLGESITRFALAVVCLRGRVCLVPGPGRGTRFARTLDWLGREWTDASPENAGAELARRFLHAYGPATADGFASWAGIHPKQAGRAWQRVAAECVTVQAGAKAAWLLQTDLEAYQSAVLPLGARFLPPYDPYLALRDRDTLVAGRAWQQRVWRITGNPGVLLLDGQFAGIWRPEKRGKRLHLTIEPSVRLSPAARQAAGAEAQRLGPLKHCAETAVEYVPPFSEG